MTTGILFFIGISSGFVTSAALFALIASMGILTRLAQMTHTARYMRWYEMCFIVGGTLGNWMYIYEYPINGITCGGAFLIGAFMGIYLGCFIGALAEVLNVFPRMMHRLGLKIGITLFVFSMAIGKSVGGILDFFIHNR